MAYSKSLQPTWSLRPGAKSNDGEFVRVVRLSHDAAFDSQCVQNARATSVRACSASHNSGWLQGGCVARFAAASSLGGRSLDEPSPDTWSFGGEEGVRTLAVDEVPVDRVADAAGASSGSRFGDASSRFSPLHAKIHALTSKKTKLRLIGEDVVNDLSQVVATDIRGRSKIQTELWFRKRGEAVFIGARYHRGDDF